MQTIILDDNNYNIMNLPMDIVDESGVLQVVDMNDLETENKENNGGCEKNLLVLNQNYENESVEELLQAEVNPEVESSPKNTNTTNSDKQSAEEYVPSSETDDSEYDVNSQNEILEEIEHVQDNLQIAEDKPIRRRKRRTTASASLLENQKKRERGKPYKGKKNIDGKWNYNINKPMRNLKQACNCQLGGSNTKLQCRIISNENRTEIFNRFWQMAWAEKRKYVEGMVAFENVKRRRGTSETSRRNYSIKYYLKANMCTYRVCKKMFINTLGLSENILLLWLKHDQLPLQTSENNNCERRKKKKLESTQLVEEFFDSIPKMESHYCRASTNKMYLETLWQSKRELFRFYKNTWCIEKNVEPVSITTFCSVYEDMGLSLYRPKKDQCALCVGHKSKNISDEEYHEHLRLKEEARVEKNADKVSEKDTVLTMDLQSVLLAPKSKVSLMYYKTKLAVHNFTMYNIKNNNGFCYLWSEIEGM